MASGGVRKHTSTRVHLRDLLESLPDKLLCEDLYDTLQSKGIEAFKEAIDRLEIPRRKIIPLLNRFMREYKTEVIKEILEHYRSKPS